MKKTLLSAIATYSLLLFSCSKPSDKTSTGHLQLDHVVLNVEMEGNRKSFQVISDTTWKLKIEPQVAWLGLSTTAGKGSCSIDLIALATNDTKQLRQTTVVAYLPYDTLQKINLLVYQHDSTFIAK